jgi:hypothetical protein
MMVMGTYKGSAEWGFPIAVAMTLKKSNGFKLGSYVITSKNGNDYKCEITAITKRRVQLVGLGWVDKKKCRFEL